MARLHRFGRAGAILLAGLVAALAGCTAPTPTGAAPTTSGSTPGSTPVPVPTPATGSPAPVRAPANHIVVAIFENKAYRQIHDNPAAPYLNGLLTRSATFLNMHAETHPSQPNYLALFTGSTLGVTSDVCLAQWHNRPNLGQQLISAGHTFTGYSEDLPSVGYTGCRRGRYAAKHNPWVNFDNVPAADNQPYRSWPVDFNQLPSVAFVVPNLCDDMHDCGIATGDAWARAHLDPYLTWAQRHNSLLIVTFDENDGGRGNQILTLIAGAGVTPGPRAEVINHYSLLRAIETGFGLPPLGGAAGATPVTGIRQLTRPS